MKIRKLVKLMHKAILDRNLKKEAKLYKKLTKKSLKKKHTEAVQ
mgnify:CR=1 FL=1|jgi:hypothetical protein